MKTYSAIDLLDKILEFIEMTPNPNDWNLKSLKSNPPRQIRFRQIKALLDAFFNGEPSNDLSYRVKALFLNDKKISIESFLRGEFIKSRTLDDYSNLVQFIDDFIKDEFENIFELRGLNLGQLIFVFPKLIEFKRQIRNLLTFNSGYLEAGTTTALFSIRLTDSISGNLNGFYFREPDWKI